MLFRSRITLQDPPFLPSLLQYHRTTTPLSPQLLQRRLTAQLFPRRITLQDPPVLPWLLQFHRSTTPLPSPQRDPLSKGQVFHRRRCERFNVCYIFLRSHKKNFQCTSTLPAPAATPSVFYSLLYKRFLTWLFEQICVYAVKNIERFGR